MYDDFNVGDGWMVGFAKVELNKAQITYDVIDGEVVIINLANGNYYSTDGTGAEIWALLAKKRTIPEIEAEFLGKYNASISEIRDSLNKFVKDLVQEGLAAVENEGGDSLDPDVTGVSDSTAEKQSYQTPVLNVYSDMQDFLLLDPIHEVDDSGWPNKKEDPAAE